MTVQEDFKYELLQARHTELSDPFKQLLLAAAIREAEQAVSITDMIISIQTLREARNAGN